MAGILVDPALIDTNQPHGPARTSVRNSGLPWKVAVREEECMASAISLPIKNADGPLLLLQWLPALPMTFAAGPYK